MRGSLFKGVVLGSMCSALVFVVSSALAGSGVGGVFNLGVSNSVDAKTTLTGASPGIQLEVKNTNAAGRNGLAVTSASSYPTGSFTNTGGGPAGAFAVNSGVTPFTVNSQAKVANLNADMVDGFHVNQIMSGGSRIAQASSVTSNPHPTPTVQATVTLTAPNNGFVLVQGTILLEDAVTPVRCQICHGFVHVHDVSANADSPLAAGTIGNGIYGGYVTIPVQWVFPVTPGSHSYTLMTDQTDPYVAAAFENPVLTAEFIPFGRNGSSTLAAPGENTVATPDQTNKDGVSQGTP